MTSLKSYIVSNQLSTQFLSFREAWLLVIQSANIDSDDGRMMLKKVAKVCRQAGADITNDTTPGLQSAIIQHINNEQERSGITMHPFLPARWSARRFREAILPEHGDRLPSLLFKAKMILMGQVTKAEESAFSCDGDSPTANVTPTVEETMPNSQLTGLSIPHIFEDGMVCPL